MTTYRIAAPAKINLGIEILGRRADGYHEIRSILAAVDLVDTLTATPVPGAEATVVTGMDISPEENLILRALNAVDPRSAIRVAIEKRIPMAAGLGGASADAAAALLIANAYRTNPLAKTDLHRLAAGLGSDVPFFLGGPCAHVSGTGTETVAVAPPAGFAVLFTPSIEIPRKTAALYGSLESGDFSDGGRIATQRSRLDEGRELEPALLANAFSRALESLAPPIVDLKRAARDAGAPFVALSGAGPSHYTIMSTEDDANALASRWSRFLPPDVAIHVAAFRATPLQLDVVAR